MAANAQDRIVMQVEWAEDGRVGETEVGTRPGLERVRLIPAISAPRRARQIVARHVTRPSPVTVGVNRTQGRKR